MLKISQSFNFLIFIIFTETFGDKTGIKLKRGENILQFPATRRNINNEIKIDIKSIQAIESDKEQTESLSKEV